MIAMSATWSKWSKKLFLKVGFFQSRAGRSLLGGRPAVLILHENYNYYTWSFSVHTMCTVPAMNHQKSMRCVPAGLSRAAWMTGLILKSLQFFWPFAAQPSGTLDWAWISMNQHESAWIGFTKALVSICCHLLPVRCCYLWLLVGLAMVSFVIQVKCTWN